MDAMKKRLAEVLVEKSYREGDFTFTSGRKMTITLTVSKQPPSEGSWLLVIFSMKF